MSDTSKATGHIIFPDERDSKFVLAATGKGWKFRSRYHRIPELFDQGPVPACVGFSSHLIARMPPKPADNKDLPLPYDVYEQSRVADNIPKNVGGSSIRGGLKVLKSLGVISRFDWIPDVQTLIEAVRDVGPVLAGTPWSQHMALVNDNGYVVYEPDDSHSGHAYVLSGVERDKGFIIANSWGPGWGNNGRAWISFATLEKLFKDGGVFALPIKA